MPGSKIPHPKQPYVVKQLVRELGGGDDAGLAVTDLPLSLSPSDVKLAASIISGEAAIGLPVVYVSVGRAGSCLVNCKEMARRLCGLAHVVIEPDRKFSFEVRDLVDGENPYGGAVGVFWPQGGGAPLRFLPTYYSEDVLSNEIVERVEFAIRSARPRAGLTWSAIENTVARINVEKLRASGDKDIGAYIETFDAELSSHKTLLAEANAEVDRLKAELRRLQSNKEVGGIIRRGSEADLFPGEARAIVISALTEAISRASNKSRSYDVLRDLVDANAITDIRIA